MTDLVVLLPPSEGKAAGGKGRWRPSSGTFGRRLGAERREVVEALARTALDERQLGVRGELFERATRAKEAIVEGRAQALPAWQRYTGVVWHHLDPATLTDGQRRRILTPSALLGLVAGTDPVPDHRLKFDVRLDVVGHLDRFWRPAVTEALRTRTTSQEVIVDLLPNEHRGAVALDELTRRRRRVVTAVFADRSGHDAKAVKGALARHLLLHGLDGLDTTLPPTPGTPPLFDDHGCRARYDGVTITVTRTA